MAEFPVLEKIMGKKYDPTSAQIIASLVSGTGETEAVSSQRAVSARIDFGTLARVDSIAQHAKKSRNEMINLLLDAGREEVYGHLETDVIEELQIIEAAAFQNLLGGRS